MVTNLQRKLIQIGQRITDGTADYDDLATLQAHKQEVLDMGDIVLCEQAGITEEEYNRGKLNPDLFYEEDFISLGIEHDSEGNPMCTIEIDDGQKLTVTEPELVGLMIILKEHKEEIEDYFHQLYESFRNR